MFTDFRKLRVDPDGNLPVSLSDLHRTSTGRQVNQVGFASNEDVKRVPYLLGRFASTGGRESPDLEAMVLKKD